MHATQNYTSRSTTRRGSVNLAWVEGIAPLARSRGAQAGDGGPAASEPTAVRLAAPVYAGAGFARARAEKRLP